LIGGTFIGALAVAEVMLWPVVVAPLFNTFTPLEKTRWSSLAPELRALTARAGVRVDALLVADRSRQGVESNAYVDGLGSSARIVLYDTLLEKHPLAEVKNTLAHELGHWRRHHVVKGLAWAVACGFLGCLALARLLAALAARGMLRAVDDPRAVLTVA